MVEMNNAGVVRNLKPRVVRNLKTRLQVPQAVRNLETRLQITTGHV